VCGEPFAAELLPPGLSHDELPIGIPTHSRPAARADRVASRRAVNTKRTSPT
jgi:hypothetical protein